MNAVVLLGPPGAGKGTVAEGLEDKGYYHVSTGALLREEIRLKTPLGIEAKKVMDHGKFVPSEVVVKMIRGMIEDAEPSARFLLDGFPRTVWQAEQLDELVAEFGVALEHVVLLECPDDALVERLAGRRTCETCGQVYHMTFNPPANGDVCDREGCALMQRDDDTEETVRKRLTVYEERTAPLIEFYEGKGLIRRINANQPIADVQADVVEVLV